MIFGLISMRKVGLLFVAVGLILSFLCGFLIHLRNEVYIAIEELREIEGRN